MTLTAGAVEQPVAGLDGIVNSISAGGVGNLPQPEANLWHGMTAIELERWDCWLSHVDGIRSKVNGLSNWDVWEKRLLKEGVGFTARWMVLLVTAWLSSRGRGYLPRDLEFSSRVRDYLCTSPRFQSRRD